MISSCMLPSTKDSLGQYLQSVVWQPAFNVPDVLGEEHTDGQVILSMGPYMGQTLKDVLQQPEGVTWVLIARYGSEAPVKMYDHFPQFQAHVLGYLQPQDSRDEDSKVLSVLQSLATQAALSSHRLRSLLLAATSKGHMSVVRYLLHQCHSKPCTRNDACKQLLINAVKAGKLELVRLLHAAGVNVRKYGSHALVEAVHGNSRAMAELLLELGAKPERAILLASKLGRITDLKMLVQALVGPPADKYLVLRKAMVCAAANGHTPALEELRVHLGRLPPGTVSWLLRAGALDALVVLGALFGGRTELVNSELCAFKGRLTQARNDWIRVLLQADCALSMPAAVSLAFLTLQTGVVPGLLEGHLRPATSSLGRARA